MNSIITLKRLVALIAEKSGKDDALAARFVEEFTKTVAEGLERDGRVTIASLGTFARDGLAGDAIVFIANDDIASAVNAPFEMFDAEELSVDFVDEPVIKSESAPQPESEHDSESEPAPEPDPVSEPAPEPAYAPEPAPETAHTPATPPAPVPAPTPVITPPPYVSVEPAPAPIPAPAPVAENTEREDVPVAEPVSESPAVEELVERHDHTDRHERVRYNDTPRHYDSEDTPRRYDSKEHRGGSRRRSFGTYVLMLIGFVMLSFIIGSVGGYFAYPLLNKLVSTDSEEVTEAVVEEEGTAPAEESVTEEVQSTADSDVAESVQPVEEPAAPEVVTDTVEAGNSLAKIARSHYGKSDFWVYIYIENESKLGNPDQIASGTVLVIPPAEKYEIDANDPESIKRAKKKAGEIYSKY